MAKVSARAARYWNERPVEFLQIVIGQLNQSGSNEQLARFVSYLKEKNVVDATYLRRFLPFLPGGWNFQFFVMRFHCLFAYMSCCFSGLFFPPEQKVNDNKRVKCPVQKTQIFPVCQSDSGSWSTVSTFFSLYFFLSVCLSVRLSVSCAVSHCLSFYVSKKTEWNLSLSLSLSLSLFFFFFLFSSHIMKTGLADGPGQPAWGAESLPSRHRVGSFDTKAAARAGRAIMPRVQYVMWWKKTFCKRKYFKIVIFSLSFSPFCFVNPFLKKKKQDTHACYPQESFTVIFFKLVLVCVCVGWKTHKLLTLLYNSPLT